MVFLKKMILVWNDFFIKMTPASSPKCSQPLFFFFLSKDLSHELEKGNI